MSKIADETIYVLTLLWEGNCLCELHCYGERTLAEADRIEMEALRDHPFEHVETQRLKRKDYYEAVEIYEDWSCTVEVHQIH